ncbi:MAG: DUF4270 family protein [Bacteroidia bacterium]|nr:DUF4270 domain-containing protein [Bacteroidia bacterium]MDW8158305.1 DUF4270 family protein [Bacteroidia bacterium]
MHKIIIFWGVAVWVNVIILGCKPDKELEGTLGIDTREVKLLVDTTHVTFHTKILNDSIATDQKIFTTNVVGHLNDPILGSIQAESYFQLLLGGENVNFGTNLELDSVKLHIRFWGKYGNINDLQSLKIFELADTLSTTTRYFNTDSKPTLPYELSDNYTYRFSDSTQLRLSIPLSLEFGKKILFADSTFLSNNQKFSSFLKGIKISSHLSQGTGCIYLIDWLSTDIAGRRATRLTLYYKSNNIPKEYDLILSLSSSARFSYLKRQTAGSWLEEFLTNPSLQDKFLPIQSTLLIYAQATIQNQLITSLKNKAINKAILILPFDKTFLNNPFLLFPPPPNLFVTLDNKLNFSNPISDAIPSYNSRLQAYEYNITTYLQSLVTRAINNNSFFIAPATAPTPSNSLHRVVLGNTGNPKFKPKLLIYFTN